MATFENSFNSILVRLVRYQCHIVKPRSTHTCAGKNVLPLCWGRRLAEGCMPLHLRPADTPHLSETASPAPVAIPPHSQWTCRAAWWNERHCGDIWWPGRGRVVGVREGNSYYPIINPPFHLHFPPSSPSIIYLQFSIIAVWKKV